MQGTQGRMPLPAYNNGPKTLSLLRYAYRDGAKAQGGAPHR